MPSPQSMVSIPGSSCASLPRGCRRCHDLLSCQDLGCRRRCQQRWWHKDWRLHEPHRLIAGPGLDDLRGVLLAILGREEDGERVGFFPPRFTPEMEGIRIPEEMPIRLTDLRLAGQFQSGALQQGIKPILDLLHRPSSAEHILSTHLRSARQQHKSGVLYYVSVDSC